MEKKPLKKWRPKKVGFKETPKKSEVALLKNLSHKTNRKSIKKNVP